MDDTSNNINMHAYLEKLFEEMGITGENNEAKQAAEEAVIKTLVTRVLKAIENEIEEDLIEEVLVTYPDVNSPEFLQEIVYRSPETQVAILDEMDAFYEEAIENAQAFA